MLAGITAVLCVVTGYTAIILHETDVKIGEQAFAMTTQLHLLESDQRPWIKVDVEKFDDLHLSDWPGLPVKFFVENVGRTPAFNVEIIPASFVYTNGNTDLFGEQKKRCTAAKSIRVGDSAGMILSNQAIIVFPKDRIPWERFGAIMGTGISIFEMEKYSPKPEGGKERAELSLWIYGCATYDFGRPNTTHQTGFVYRIARLIKRPNLPDAISYGINPDERVPKDQIILFPSPSADGITN
jgi:hypothetical protein